MGNDSIRPAFHVRVSAGMFQHAFPQKKKCFFIHVEMRLQNHRIRLVVARHFYCLHKFKVMCMCVAWYEQHTCGKITQWAMFPCTGKVPASGNVFMEMVTGKCSRMTFLLVETCTWKADLIASITLLHYLIREPRRLGLFDALFC